MKRRQQTIEAHSDDDNESVDVGGDMNGDGDQSVGNYSTDDDMSLYSKDDDKTMVTLSNSSRRRYFNHNSNNSNNNNGNSVSRNSELKETANLLRKDNKIRLIRMAALLVLMLAAVLVSLFVYQTLQESEEHEFETIFSSQAKQVGNALRKELKSKLRVIDSLSVTTTSYANSKGRTWPNVTIPEFSYRAASTLTIARAISLALQPVVNTSQLAEWEQYSVDQQRWITEDLDFQELYPAMMDEMENSDSDSDATYNGGRSRTRNRRMQSGGGAGSRPGGGPRPPPRVSNMYNVSQFVFTLNQYGVPQKSTKDIAVPFWQHSPVLEGLPWINYDVGDKQENRGPIWEVLNKQQAALSLIYELADSIHGYNFDPMNETLVNEDWDEIWGVESTNNAFAHHEPNGNVRGNPEPDTIMEQTIVDSNGRATSSTTAANEEATMYTMLGGPAVNIWYPVFADLGVSDERRSVVAILSMTTKWESFLLPNLPVDANGLIVVIGNSCDQMITFDITDDVVTFLGAGDQHNAKYDDLQQTFDIHTEIATFSKIRLSQDYCPYTATVYPSHQMRQQFETSDPAIYTTGVAMIFSFAIAVFVLYDYLVERRQKFLAETAHKSSVIVSGLFPRAVRDRLFEEKQERPTGQNKKINPFLNGGPNFSKNTKPSSTLSSTVNKDTQIADLYTSTTVMFGDIAGFTAWSSTREPSEVFVLLETLYSAFDKTARRMDVFKVETIGDCYMAVTGLPNPQDDHHLIMVRFARRLLYKTAVLTKELEATLGPDTANLCFRIGLHSGPVTAGVLRGEKSRFQLFGDTVNTASRMESTGLANRIQVSQSTADLIAASNKTHWLKKRDEMIEAKGKGRVQTYWIKAKTPSNSETSHEDDTSRTEDPSSMFMESQNDTTDEHGVRKSLVDWQVDLLSKQLKQIARHRLSKKKRNRSRSRVRDGEGEGEGNDKHDKEEGDGIHREPRTPNKRKSKTKRISQKMHVGTPRDAMAESIRLSAMNLKRTKSSAKMLQAIELPEAVVQQLEAFLWTIAKLYQEVNFHNYEHACHVTMSANKYLQSILAAAESDNVDDPVAQSIMADPLTQFAIIFSCLIHDVGHPGVTNQQLIYEEDPLAARFGNRSILEQNSIQLAFDTLTCGDYPDLLKFLCTKEKDYNRFRQLVINCVMATDIFDPDLLEFRNQRWEKAFGVHAHSGNGEEEEAMTDLKATVVMEHILQAADVAHTMQHWHIFQKWNQRLFEEMCHAFHSGRSTGGDPADTWYQGELHFFDNYIIPLARKLGQSGPFCDECLNYALQNRSEWESKGQALVLAMKKEYEDKNGLMDLFNL